MGRDNQKSAPSKDKLLALLWIAVVFIGLVLPAFLVFFGVHLFRSAGPKLISPEGKVQELTASSVLTPSDILNNKAAYTKKRVTVRGKLSQAPVVCQKKICPAEDSCCGCPDRRSLLLADAGVVLSPKSWGRLELVVERGEKPCQRLAGSCEYRCREWVIGDIYDVEGTFFAEPPPPGWNLSLSYYLMVENMKTAGKLTSTDSLRTIIKEIKDNLRSFFTPETYLIQ